MLELANPQPVDAVWLYILTQLCLKRAYPEYPLCICSLHLAPRRAGRCSRCSCCPSTVLRIPSCSGHEFGRLTFSSLQGIGGETQGKPCSQMKWDFRRILGMRKEAGLQQASKPRQAGGATLSPQLFGVRAAHLPVRQLNLI